MAENEIITREDPQMQLFSQLMEGTLKKLERYCATARPMLDGEVYLSSEEVCSHLRLSTRTLKSTETQERFFSTKSEGRYYTSRATYRQCLKNIITQYPRNYGKNR